MQGYLRWGYFVIHPKREKLSDVVEHRCRGVVVELQVALPEKSRIVFGPAVQEPDLLPYATQGPVAR